MDKNKFNICFVLEQKYKKTYNLPKNWDKFGNLDLKMELLSTAINKKTQLENLKEFKEINDENK